ncbi:HAD-IC family P-type ATPase [Mycolicibacterium novocastrense]|nr:HAD-IC family P-type ATPase [Mycolicibacterium novocastrense]
MTTGSGPAAAAADVTVGLWRNGAPPPWAADVLLSDLAGVWRMLHALPAARHAAAKGVEASASSSVLGALMLMPDVVGNGPAAGNLAALAALWTGYRIGDGVFGEALPHPEPGHEWHALPVEEVRRLLPRPQRAAGTSNVESADAALGPLQPITAATTRAWRQVTDLLDAIREDLADPMTPFLATGAAASALLGSPLDAALVAGVLLLNTAISAQQSLHAERVLDRLLAVQDPLARRLIGSTLEERYEDVPAGALLPGDLIRVKSGEVVPADARVIAADAAEADESALTGESLPVAKASEPAPGAPLAERASMLYAGTTLLAGRVTAVVTAVGASTQMNRVAAMSGRKTRQVGLQAQLAHITGRALPWSLTGGAAVGLLSLLRRTPLRDAASGAVAVAVAAVPEGLPLVATLAQLAAARELTDSSVLIRNPRAVEAFARLDVVCFDKTGTLSQNRLQVKSVRPLAEVEETQVLAAAVHTVRPTTSEHSDHATDDAVRLAAAECDVFPGGTDARVPFQSDRPFAGALIGTRLSVKGAPEAVMAALAGSRDELSAVIDEMTAAGLRVLAVGERELTPEQAAAACIRRGAAGRIVRLWAHPAGRHRDRRHATAGCASAAEGAAVA